MITREFTLGDTAVSVYAKLYRPSSSGPSPVVLGVADTVAFRMIDSAGAAKVSDAAATVVDVGSSTTGEAAEVRYDWAAGDVDTAGDYVAWFIVTSAGATEHFPSQDRDDPEFKIVIRART